MLPYIFSFTLCVGVVCGLGVGVCVCVCVCARVLIVTIVRVLLQVGTGSDRSTVGNYTREDLDIFNFSLTSAEVSAINALQK